MRSHKGPEAGISMFLSRVLMVSMVVRLGESPPCTQNTCPSTMAARGRQSKASLKQYQTLWLPYLRAIQSQNPQTQVMFRDSWFPRSSTTISGCFSLQRNSKRIVSTELYPRSTQSPRNTYRYLDTAPPRPSSQSRSQNCPWTSPQMVTGAWTGCTFDYSKSRALTLRHNTFTASSGTTLHQSTASISASTFINTLYSKLKPPPPPPRLHPASTPPCQKQMSYIPQRQ